MVTKKLLCLIGFTVSLLMVSSASAQNPSGLELSGSRFKQQQSVNFNPRLSVARSGSDDDSTGILVRNIYSTSWLSRAQATAHNTSSRTIKVIDWEYSFFADAGMQQELRSYRIHTKTKLRPGETKVLKGDVSSPALSRYQKARPIRIEYTDGTVWPSP